MKPSSQPRIVSAERLEAGLVIEFDDGKAALYSAPLLYALLSQATVIGPAVVEEEEDA